MKDFFAKILARSRKHLGTETVNVYTVRNLYISALTDLIETVGIDEALKRIFAWGFSMGHEYMLSLMKDISFIKLSIYSWPIEKPHAKILFNASSIPTVSIRSVNADMYKFLTV